MTYVLRILTKALANERAWLRMESLATADRKYAEGARMAKERIPQLELAIKILTQHTSSNAQRKAAPKLIPVLPVIAAAAAHTTKTGQLNLFAK